MRKDISAILAKKEARKLKRAENVRFIASVASKDAPGGSNGRTACPNHTIKAAKGKIRRFRTKRAKRLSNSKLEALRWEAFAAVIRERDAYNGCFVCKTEPIEQAGHTIPRGRSATKYHEENVHGWCAKCNYMDDQTPGYHDWAVVRHIAVYGDEQYKNLVELSRTTLQESRHDILTSAWHYLGRMADGERKDKIKNKLAPLVPVEYGGTLAGKA